MPFDWTAILNWGIEQAPIVGTILMILGGLVVVGSLYVKLTPNVKDDAWWAKLESTPLLGDIMKAIVAFSPFNRKEAVSLTKKR